MTSLKSPPPSAGYATARVNQMSFVKFVESTANLSVLSAIQSTNRFIVKNKVTNAKTTRQLSHYSWNPLLHYHGVSYGALVNATSAQLQKMYEYIDKNVDFMMILEELDASLVMLKGHSTRNRQGPQWCSC